MPTLATELTPLQLAAANHILRAYRLPEQAAPASTGSLLSAIAPGMELGRFARLVLVLTTTIEDVSEAKAD
jgi:hypothetical protein